MIALLWIVAAVLVSVAAGLILAPIIERRMKP